MQRVDLAGVQVDLHSFEDAVRLIIGRAGGNDGREDPGEPPLSVVSANLDHIAQFGRSGRWYGTLDYRLGSQESGTRATAPAGIGAWLTLPEEAPLVAESERLAGRTWPRLAGSDLAGPLLDAAEANGISVGFLGGTKTIQRLLSRQLTRTRPDLMVSGMWAPERSVISSHEASLELAAAIADSGTQLLIVGLGKPRQELWMAEYGRHTGANVLLAFGTVVDFLAGAMRRTPRWASENGLEWAWRLVLEPKRLARRYLVDGPPSLIQLRQDSRIVDAPDGVAAAEVPADPVPAGTGDGSFIPPGGHADVVVYAVTYNSADTVDALIAGLRREAAQLRLRVIVADNNSTDGTLDRLAAHPDVCALPTGGNLGYAGGINAARRVPGGSDAVLVLNPDLTVEPGAITALYRRLRRSEAGIVVPQLFGADGATYPSLRREPSIPRAVGDALFGARQPSRPGWLAETDYDPESYRHPHRIEWATGAALLIRADLAERLGDWDERFFLYSEEVDYFRRAREAGESIWYEPASRMVHQQGGSGSSVQLDTLMAVNRVRYVRKYHSAAYAGGFRASVVLGEALRCYQPSRLSILRTILDERRWDALPGPEAKDRAARVLEGFPEGTVIIPAHNEAAVIGRTLDALAPAIATGRIEVIVACNGCTDDTAEIAKAYDGVRVLQVDQASKIAALNAADAAATLWPRLYLDADIEISPAALRLVLDRLRQGSVLAARPAFRYDDDGASWPVRAFYRARRRIPSTTQALWGAGVYGLTEQGHRRFGTFPPITGDDLFVDQQFGDCEKAVVGTPPVAVRTPRTVQGLRAILRRNYRGQGELRHYGKTAGVPQTDPQPGTGRTVRELLRSVRGPLSALDAAVYSVFVAAARLRRPSPGRSAAWERDDSSRA